MRRAHSESQSPRQQLRSRSGCNTCRARKVKCDERPGRCRNCERLDLTCSDGNRPSTQQVDSRALPVDGGMEPRRSGSTKMRTFRSCINCRASKTKCSGQRPVCERCSQKGSRCLYSTGASPAWAQQILADQTRSESRISASVPQRGEISPVEDATLSWLTTPQLPAPKEIRVLVGEYFENIHPLRCFAFIHKPTFLQKLDQDLANDHDRNALLHIICALGAQFCSLKHNEISQTLLPKSILLAGSDWARKAQHLIFAELGNITVENLMAAVLLHDYELRLANFTNAFLLSGMVTRMVQALQINLEYSTDVLCEGPGTGPSASVKESRRRLMWSCYTLDALVGSGVTQLTLIDERDVKIQLPCNERSFVQIKPCITEILERGQVLSFISAERKPENPASNMGMMSYFIRHLEIRKRVLLYIKHLDKAIDPWLPDSEFSTLDAECRYWYDTLPADLQFTPTAIYIRKDTSQLGALCLLHYAYHQTMCDLYRIGSPALYKLRAGFNFPTGQHDYLNHLQYTLFEHARSLAMIAAESLSHGAKILADTWLPTITYDSCRIMLYYLTQLIDPALESSKKLMVDTIPHLQNSIKALKTMRSLFAVADPLYSAAETMFEKSGIGSEIIRPHFIPDTPYPANPDEAEGSSIPGTPAQSAPDYVLNPLSIYRMARRDIREKHAPEKMSSPAASTTQRVSHTDIQPPPQPNNQDDLSISPSYNYHPSAAEQASFDELQLFLTSDLGWTWQPGETAVGSGTEGFGLPPWSSSFRPGELFPSMDPQLESWSAFQFGQQ